jgi:hypothetical protein
MVQPSSRESVYTGNSVYKLRDVREIQGEAAAEQLGLSIAATKSRLHRARAMLRDRFSYQGCPVTVLLD